MTRRLRSTIAADLDSIHLAFGDHASREEGMCLMEAVAYVAGEPHTDRPQCVCPVLASFGRSWNDGLPDEDRQRLLKPFIPRLIGTRSTPEMEQRRAFMATDWVVRTCAPMWLRAAGLDDEAASLEALPPLTSAEACSDAMPTIAQARHAARTTVTDAVRAAVTDAAKDAARAAGGAAAVFGAWTAVWDVDVYAARTAAGTAAWDVGVYAAGAAAWAAGGAARTVLRPHVERLQASAVDLYEQMIEIGDAP